MQTFAVLALTLSIVLITFPVFQLPIFSITSSVFPYVCLLLRLYMAYFVPLLLGFMPIIYLYIPPLMPYLKSSDNPNMQVGRPALFWDIKQSVVENHYRRFGTAYRSHLQWSSNFRFLDP